MVPKILMFSRALSESLQARSSQTACIPFCSGYESWCSDHLSMLHLHGCNKGIPG